MRPFDARLLEILSTETAYEQKLKQDPQERDRFSLLVRQAPGKQVRTQLKDPVTLSRILRYVPWPLHRHSLVEMTYVASGSARITIGGQLLVLHQGDLFLPNQYSELSMDPLGERDILLNFILKPQFVEDVCVRMNSGTILSDFMMETLRGNISWNRYLHFDCPKELPVHNLIEAMAYAAFPWLDDENIACGSDPDPRATSDLMVVLFRVLTRSLGALKGTSPANFDEVIRQVIGNYITEHYRTASLRELARMVNQSESALSRRIKAVFGLTFKELLMQARFDRAVVLLQQTKLPVTAIAEAVGYENTSFFYRRFRQLYGISPKEFR